MAFTLMDVLPVVARVKPDDTGAFNAGLLTSQLPVSGISSESNQPFDYCNKPATGHWIQSFIVSAQPTLAGYML
jgi:hypothetical protein